MEKIYSDLKSFNHFEPNKGGHVAVSALDAKFSAPLLLQGLQTLGAAFHLVDLTRYNEVELRFNDSDHRVDGITKPGHILEGTRHWQVERIEGKPCAFWVKTWGIERSHILGVSAIRYLGAIGIIEDLQQTVWHDYLKNIGDYWHQTKKAKVTGP